jgi:hypothetical protein
MISMKTLLFWASLGLGVLVISWIAQGFAFSNWLALSVTLVIGVIFISGYAELNRYRRATRTLMQALGHLNPQPVSLDEWLAKIDISLQMPVRQRIEGLPVALPGPVMTPYLVGLLVMLGLLGTFIGMVVTLRGAVLALEGTTELQAMRTGLAVPIQGLGLAFGTSVAGIAASALLGLAATLSRRDRLLAGRALDFQSATVLQEFSLPRQQAQAVPHLLDALQSMTRQWEQISLQTSQTMLAQQAQLHDALAASQQSLSVAMLQSVERSAEESARKVALTMQPLLAQTMTAIREASEALFHARIESERTWLIERDTLLGRHQELLSTLEQATATQQNAVKALTSQWQDQNAQLAEQHGQLQQTLEANQSGFQSSVLAAYQQLADSVGQSLQCSVINSARLTGEVLQPLMADAMQQLQQENARLIASGRATEAAWLEERQRLMHRLDLVLASIEQAALGQREANSGLLQAAAQMLDSVQSQFAVQLEREAQVLVDAATQNSGSVLEMASMSDGFAHAVTVFGESNEKLMMALQDMSERMELSLRRSDEQLSYYLAQAREIVDMTVMSQQQVHHELQQLARRSAKVAQQEEA